MSSESQGEPLSKLNFKHDLLRSRNARELVASLETLAKELAQLKQDETDLSSVAPVAEQLVSPRLMKHKEAGIRAFTADCLMDILRIYAPNAPFSLSTLKNIFEFYFREFPNLGNPDHPYFRQYYRLLENMAQIQCIALIPDLPDPEPMVVRIFEIFYEIATKSNQVAGIEYYLGSILSQLVGEYVTLHQRVTELILSHLLGSRPPKSRDAKNMTIPLQVSRGYTISKDICNENIDIMIRHVNQYFSAVFTTLHEDADEGDYSEKSLQRVQNLIVETWKACPEVLVNIVGQLEQELLVENSNFRLLATETVGRMLSYFPSKVNFVLDHHTTYTVWLGRIRDKDTRIRAAWTEGAAHVINNRTDNVVLDIITAFLERLEDPDESVRAVACDCIGEFSLETIGRFPTVDGKVLAQLGDRLRDRKQPVRAKAFEAAGKLYDTSYGNEKIQPLLEWIPSALFGVLFLNDTEVNELLDDTLMNYVFPRNDDDGARSRRILTVFKSLSKQEESIKAFSAIWKRQVQLAKVFETLLSSIRQYNDPSASKSAKDAAYSKVTALIKWFSSQFVLKEKIAEDLDAIVRAKERQGYKILMDSVSPESDYTVVVQSIDMAVKRFKGQAQTLRTLLNRMCFLVYNKSIVGPLVEISQHPQDPLCEGSHAVLKDIASSAPDLLKTQSTELTGILEKASPKSDGNVDTLKAARMLFSKFPEDVPESKPLRKSLVNIALNGTIRESKQAVKTLSHLRNPDSSYDELTTNIISVLHQNEEARNDANLAAKISALSQLYIHIPSLLEEYSTLITSFLVNTILLSEATDTGEEDDKPWVSDEELNSDCQLKLLAIDALINRLRGLSGWEEADEIARPVFKLLIAILSQGGDIHPDKNLPLSFKSRLRLKAGLKLLKLARTPFYEKMIRASDIDRLVFLVQDSCLPVRSQFIRRLTRYLAQSGQYGLPSRYLPLIFLTAFEVDREVLTYSTTWIKARMHRQMESEHGATTIEHSFARLLYLISHHQDFFDDEDQDEDQVEKDIQRATQCIVYYLDLVAHKDNAPQILYMAQNVKQYSDRESESSRTLYLVADIAQFAVLKYANLKGWTLLSWPGSVQLPGDAFKPLPSNEANKVSKTSYLEDQYTSVVEEAIKKTMKRDKAAEDGDGARNGSTKRAHADSKEDKPKGYKRTLKAPSKAKRVKRSDDSEGSGDEGNALTEEGPRRTSGRLRRQVNYAQQADVESEEEQDGDDNDDEEDDEDDDGEEDGDGNE
uniref:ARAD1C18656p n=1 Tax=Blastobotrys adeninivorans TaxID=409370 RepID=A0A060T6D2_BLAAD